MMQNGTALNLVDYLERFDWKINDSKNPQRLGSEYQTLQRDGTHTVQCYRRTFNDVEIEDNLRKVSHRHSALSRFIWDFL